MHFEEMAYSIIWADKSKISNIGTSLVTNGEDFTF